MTITRQYVTAGIASIVGYAVAVAVGVPWYAAATGPALWVFFD